MRFVIVTGMSGAGKSTALKMLEDMGYFCVDNLPIPLLSRFVEMFSEPDEEVKKIALGIDIRGGQDFGGLKDVLDEMDVKEIEYEILFLDAQDDVLIKRYKETRRQHPLSGSGRVDTGIAKEREKIMFLKMRATYILDTSKMLTRELKLELEKIFVKGQNFCNLYITVMSFGFKYGIPSDSDLVFDVRFLPNPYYIDGLREKTGNDPEVQDYVMGNEKAEQFLDKLKDMTEFLIPNYILEGKNQLVISIGCTGHIVYSLLPVINEIAIETGVRPERPISASIVSSQQAITACPISAATVGILAFMAEATNYTKVNIFTLLIVCVPATLIGTIVAAIAVIKKGKELADDPEFQARVEAGLIEDFSKKVKEEKKVSKEAKISVTIFLIAMVGIVLLGAVSGLVPTLADGSKLPLTTVIEIFMLVAAAAMILLTKLDSNKVLDQPVFRTGMFAVVLAFGLCWLVNTFIGDQSSFITDNMSALTNKYPWIFIVAVFIVGAITTSQSSTTMIMIPIGIALGLPANVIVAGWIACSSNYFIPASGQCVAALAFDSAGTTKIGKFVLNHSYMIPGLVCTVVSVVVALLIGAVVF